MIVTLLHPRARVEHLGLIPHWSAAEPITRSFVEIVKKHYVGGWHSWAQGSLDTATGTYSYPGDPVMQPFASLIRAHAREIIFAYESEFFAVVYITPEVQAAMLSGSPLPSDLSWDMARLN